MTGCTPGKLLGFWALLLAAPAEFIGGEVSITLHFGDAERVHPFQPKLLEEAALRDAVLEHIASASFFGSAGVESFLQLDGGVGRNLLTLNRAVSANLVGHAYIERHGPDRSRFDASIIVCLHGRPEYLFLQAASFSMAPGSDAYEFIFVCNSPELIESLQREARIAAMLYGLSLTLIFLPGNAGFGAANNAAVSHARSGRILIVSPDVFPRDPSWAKRHATIVEAQPASQTMMFGVPLFSNNGTLIHGGMYFETDTGLSVRQQGIMRQNLLRVEHYGRGAPPATATCRQTRRVPAVTGAFISADRRWFEKIGGFSQDYVSGHYEDADLSLRSWNKGGEVWLHDLPLWHLEGMGSVRGPSHEGGSIVNRWQFTKTWVDIVQQDFQNDIRSWLRA